MVRFTAVATAVLAAILPLASADQAKYAPESPPSSKPHHIHHHQLVDPKARPARSKSTTAERAAVVNAASGSASLQTSATLPPSVSSDIATITSGLPATTPTYSLPATFRPGQQNTFIKNAPALPDPMAARPIDFPELDKVPPTNSPQAQIWLQQYASQLAQAPKIPQTTDQAACSSNQENLANAAANHWWTCGGYTANDDITTCPDKNTWGVSYDDGPSPYTPKLIDYFEKHGDIKSTFFIVGSRAISRPDILQYEYMKGHQLSVHTWSHTALTTQSNEQILLELAWTKEVIRKITGVTPNTMRPPYGDIDDRVRYICKLLNLTPIIWTSLSSSQNFDTNDWKIQSGMVSTASVVSTFESILQTAPSLPTGYIVLAHDLYQQSVDLAVSVVLPMAQAMNPAQKLMPIITCLKKPLGDAYVETNRNLSSDTSSGSSGSSEGTRSAAFHQLAVPLLILFGSICLGAAILV